ncbi:sodium:alanine symporter family protein [Halosquirtibacter xylanolyticus]|uniref:alanine/glycine:cation symporter family protein n=1 Tax=Halosquirtibacter xylanolyticus TaxID=3374599 RepID=UPI0037480A01|nr:sodium:alanine symporter family protein [Prolixibacteraceae bacterium]
MNYFLHIIQILESYISGSLWFVLLLLGTGLFYTIYLGFPQIRHFGTSIKVLRGKYDNPDDKGDTSHFQALTTALSGTVGTGNIAGVAFAIHLGGPSALFWMLVTALLGMCTKFVEVVMSHKYREINDKGTVSGGPMYYMKNGLKWKWMPIIFAIATVISSFGTGCLPQVNSIANSLHATLGIDKMLSGAVLALLLAMVVLGGIKRIAKVTETLIPLMAILYIIGAMGVLAYNYENILPSIASIFTGIFSGSAATGGFLGASLAFAFNRGVNRGLFSNEAGQGSAPIAHASARCSNPVHEGFVALLEPFIDTIIICSITGITLLSSGVWKEKIDNPFERTNTIILSEKYQESNPSDVNKLKAFIVGEEKAPTYSGELEIVDGKISNELTVLHAHSMAEDIEILFDNKPYSGMINVLNGIPQLDNKYQIHGRSLIHSAPLTTEAFTRSYFGKWGKYIVSIGLLLFAFSTAIAWAYYGSTAIIFLVGTKYVNWFLVVYVVGFFIAAFADTTLIWAISGIMIALMTIPNLIGILFMHKEIKQELKQFEKDDK